MAAFGSTRFSKLLAGIKAWAKALKSEIAVVAGAARDARTPWYAMALALFVVAYAVSPIDLIPDFIPILGFIDDAILLPIGLVAVRRLIPPDVLADHRARIADGTRLPPSRVAAAVIVALWIAGIVAIGMWMAG